MDVIRDDLLNALGATAPPLVLAALARQLGNLPPVLTAGQAGGAILAAICPDRRFGDLGGKRLAGCDLTMNGITTRLSPDDCCLHPGLSDWVPHAFALAVMLPAEAACLFMAACTPVPVFERVGVVVGEGVCSGQLVMTFPTGGVATAYYGQLPNPSLFSSTAYLMSGDSLFNVGERLRGAAIASDAMARCEEHAERAAVAATVH